MLLYKFLHSVLACRENYYASVYHALCSRELAYRPLSQPRDPGRTRGANLGLSSGS